MAVNRNRKTRLVEVDTIDSDSIYGTLGDLLALVQALVRNHGADAQVSQEERRYSDGEYIAVKVYRDETDEEMQERIADEERWEAARQENERREYQRLREKFGN